MNETRIFTEYMDAPAQCMSIKRESGQALLNRCADVLRRNGLDSVSVRMQTAGLWNAACDDLGFVKGRSAYSSTLYMLWEMSCCGMLYETFSAIMSEERTSAPFAAENRENILVTSA